MKNFISSALLLIAIGAVTTATSVRRPNPTPIVRDYEILSTCKNASVRSGEITTKDDSIISPVNNTFKKLGLPVDYLLVNAEYTVTGTTDEGIIRMCTHKYISRKGNVVSEYNCIDNNGYSCSITFNRLQKTSE